MGLTEDVANDRDRSMARYSLAMVGCLVLTSCGRTGGPAQPAVSAQGVRVASFKVEAGKATEDQLRTGLQSAADALSVVCGETRKAHAQLKGHLRGTFHIEPDGTVRMFAESGSEFMPPEAKTVSGDFFAAASAGKWKFPRIGDDLLLRVDFEIE